jgi:hypothetical protein
MTQAANLAGTGVCKAWVNFAGASGTINSSVNVTSVTRNSTGDYTVTFTNALANANYAVIGSALSAAGTIPAVYVKTGTTPSTSSFIVYAANTNGSVLYDFPTVYIAVFGN